MRPAEAAPQAVHAVEHLARNEIDVIAEGGDADPLADLVALLLLGQRLFSRALLLHQVVDFAVLEPEILLEQADLFRDARRDDRRPVERSVRVDLVHPGRHARKAVDGDDHVFRRLAEKNVAREGHPRDAMVVELVPPGDVLPRELRDGVLDGLLARIAEIAFEALVAVFGGAQPFAAGGRGQHEEQPKSSHFASFFLRKSARFTLCFFSYSCSFSIRAMSSWMRFTSLKM